MISVKESPTEELGPSTNPRIRIGKVLVAAIVDESIAFLLVPIDVDPAV
jgi:hypothetical protein